MSQRARVSALIACLTLLLTLAGAMLTPRPLQAQEPTPTWTLAVNSVLPDDAFLRGGPGRGYLPVGRLIGGAAVVPLSRNDDASWIMIAYGTGYGWIRSDLVSWVDDLLALPVLASGDLTPSPAPGAATATLFFPTATPQGNWANVGEEGAFLRAGPGRTYLVRGAIHAGDVVEPVARTEDAGWVMVRVEDGFAWVRSDLVRWQADLEALAIVLTDEPLNLTPSLTFTPSATLTRTPTATVTASPTLTLTSTLTLTPSSTSTGTLTPSFTPTLTLTASATQTDTATPTDTATQTDTATLAATATLTKTATQTPTLTKTATLTETATQEPTATVTLTETSTATQEPTATLTNTVTQTATQEPTTTATLTETATQEPTATLTLTVTPSPEPTDPPPTDPPPTDPPTEPPADPPTATPTPEETPGLTAVAQAMTDTPDAAALATAVDALEPPPTFTPMPPPPALGDTPVPTDTSPPPTATASPTLTATEAPSSTPTDLPATETPAPTDTPEPTDLAVIPAVTQAAAPPGAGDPPSGSEGPGDVLGNALAWFNDLPQSVRIGAVMALLLGAYAMLYIIGSLGVGRYTDGFVIETCPVCQKGELSVVNRTRRALGIPRVRRTVHCDYCGSVLRQVGRTTWRYTVDGDENPELFKRYNGREITDAELITLGRPTRMQMVMPQAEEQPDDFEPPTYMDGA